MSRSSSGFFINRSNPQMAGRVTGEGLTSNVKGGFRASLNANTDQQLPENVPDLFAAKKLGEVYGGAIGDFMTRFGLRAVVQRNLNVVNALVDPKASVDQINYEYFKMAENLGEMYQNYYAELVNQGVPSGYAQQSADEYILPLVEAQLRILELKFPFSFGGVAGPEGATEQAGRMLLNVKGKDTGVSYQGALEINKALGLAKPKKKKKKSK